MLWECCEGGARVERVRPPAVCRDCGIGGASFVPAERELWRDSDAVSLRELWVEAGYELARGNGNLDWAA